MRRTLATIECATGSLAGANEPHEDCRSSLNFAVTDGETVVVSRYRSGTVEEPPSLYYARSEGNATVMVASEPLDYHTRDDSLSWKLIEKNVIMSFEPEGGVPRRHWGNQKGCMALTTVVEHVTKSALLSASQPLAKL